MADVGYIGSHPNDFLGATAAPLLEACNAVVSGMAVPEECLSQVALNVGFQALCKAAADAGGIANHDVVSAYGAAFVASVVAETDSRMIQDHVVAMLHDVVERTVASHRAQHPCDGAG